ncbi:MAG TPA: sialidase family protein, partial [Candidatus Kapabacteria bacterium]|nr:sialidase family protein [Candidatus Kapabacteria bacterium]
MKSGIGYRVSGIGRSVVFVVYIILVLCQIANAQHLRVFACAIANDSAGASMGASSIGSGLYQSDDTGKTWKQLGWDNIKCYSMDMVQSSNGRILYEATGLGVLRSTDYGEHWKQLTDWRISEVMDVAITQNRPDQITLLTPRRSQSESRVDPETLVYFRQVWQSQNSGRTWTKVKIGFDDELDAKGWYDRLEYD